MMKNIEKSGGKNNEVWLERPGAMLDLAELR